ncbi:efflux RND transporter periplasmic adaptor subunit [Xylanibacillus composti]|uniref:Efflux RND transporter periplasmic adaptor subunit n=1 Tax=Xylanibacillus composti TaxID=1572762 RepID=A0A8J4M1C2_9BACL|nr:efflux RND transporter periplasmic adaptor subunit [Xylanibacillus composti]MDT9724334.1 efflux RND transporter periplasmic adaptor subunit [Xylanibacillus composti]GIQ67925.1 efflux RND transporter periplasmic adaptor subunit [Xylanibacillus composti]
MFTKWWTGNLSRGKRGRLIRATAVLTAATVLASGCALLPDETVEEEIPNITAPRISQKPEYEVTTSTLEQKVSGIGKIMSMKEETVFFPETALSGQLRIKEIYVSTGDTVTEGDLIAELEVKELTDQLRQKELQFKRRELEMKQTLRNRNEMTEEEYEQAVIDFEIERQDIVKLREDIEAAKLRAPFTGTIVSVSAQKGQTIQAYDEVALIADLTQLTVAAKLSVEDLKKIAPGLPATVDINANGTFTGTVQRLPVQNQDNNNSGGGRYNPYNPPNQQNQESIDDYLLVTVEGLPSEIQRGTPLSVSVVTDRRENAVVIPPSTLRTYGGRTYVQVVEEDGTKREVDVEVGLQTSTQVQIVKGLEPGQKVVGK